MTATNLSICFAPNLLRPPASIGLADQIEESPIATGLLVLFIEHYDTLFDSVQKDITFNANTDTAGSQNGKSAPKIALTDNLLPPPPMTAAKSEPAPALPPKKPTPKYVAGKKAGSPKMGSHIPPPLATSNGSLSSDQESFPSPPPSPLPPPLDEVPLTTSGNNLPAPVLPPKPKLKSSSEGRDKLRKSAKKSKKVEEAPLEELKLPQLPPPIPITEAELLTPPPPIPEPPMDFEEVTASLPPITPTSPGLGRTPPSRPSSVAPSFTNSN